VGLPVSVLLWFAALAPEPDRVPHRIWNVPNPYDLSSSPPSSPLGPETPPLPEPKGPPRYFVIEDSADMMGLPLTGNVLLGFQVEFTGPGEESAAVRKTTRVAVDPYHPRFLMPTGGVRISF
jgi:hypothetical protein